MKKHNNRMIWIARLSALLLLACSFGVQATAPRITAQLFGEERKADIVAYQSTGMDSRSETALMVQLVTEAFKSVGKTPVVDVLPSKQLATYALFNNDVVALIGIEQDVSRQDKKQYNVVTFYLKGDEAVALIFSKVRGADLHKAFVGGMHKILKNGRYQELIVLSGDKLPADYVSRIKRMNPGWK